MRKLGMLMIMSGLMALAGCARIPAACEASGGCVIVDHKPMVTEARFLPDPYPVYTAGNTVVNAPYCGMHKRYIPTKNLYTGNDGCYVMCYSHSPVNAIYSVEGDIYTHGQLRVPGYYIGRICVPHGYEHKDISASPYFKNLCNQHIHSCNKNCWAGGDTGGWFGIP